MPGASNSHGVAPPARLPSSSRWTIVARAFGFSSGASGGATVVATCSPLSRAEDVGEPLVELLFLVGVERAEDVELLQRLRGRHDERVADELGRVTAHRGELLGHA